MGTGDKMPEGNLRWTSISSRGVAILLVGSTSATESGISSGSVGQFTFTFISKPRFSFLSVSDVFLALVTCITVDIFF